MRLLLEFRHEQTDPGRFYGVLADDSVRMLASYTPLDGTTLLDVGGGPGYFADAFARAGATYFSIDVDSDLADESGRSRRVVGTGAQLPFRDEAFDVVYSSNVLEHVSEPWTVAEEMLRVLRPGGMAFISYTVWFGPWGGHETAPWHFLGGHRARRRYRRKFGTEPKNRFGETLFAVTVRDGMRWADGQHPMEVVDLTARYNPRWAHFLLRVPILREVLTWNLAIVIRKR
ncbi:class I SAM-dependent methyltransferase [Nocardioides sp. STR2]|uniref:Class I SAM-dependent methyltransferase n=1 Tax=Nocardioides pini TaxID=2975053 RepID=A0ABT4CE98_9ACTN|nr:class I SAM-dependent methyltransferase [Nocardioides pini]MCY4726192.1 class I SAM-dependent methyltransferase [Nocardioides pini]